MVSTNKKPYNIFCELCGQEYNIIADEQDVVDWLSGDKYIQEALSYLSAAERELLISRTCDTCWKHMYNEVDDEE